MSILDSLSQLLGAPRGRDQLLTGDSWTEVNSELGIEIPGDVRDILDSYGGMMIGEFLTIHHPEALVDVQSDFSGQIEGNRWIPGVLLPKPGGMLLWGSTIDADQLFLVPGADGWRVAAWCRQWVEWYESGMGLGDWLLHAFSPSFPVEWLPEWEFPLEVDEL